jgi:hypothetical protein
MWGDLFKHTKANVALLLRPKQDVAVLRHGNRRCWRGSDRCGRGQGSTVLHRGGTAGNAADQ